MNKLRIFLTTIVLGGLPFLASAQSKTSMQLKECVQYAIAHNYNIQTAHFDEYVAKRESDYLVGLGLPQISGSATSQYNIQVPQFVTAMGNLKIGRSWQHNLALQASQLIFDATFLLGTQAAKEYVNLSRINTQRTEIEVIANVTSAYYNASRAKEGGALIDVNLARLEKRLKDVKAMFDNGLVEKTDLDRVQILVNNLQVEKQKYNRLLMLSVDMLKFQMGMDLDTDLTLAEEVSNFDMDKETIPAANNVDYYSLPEYRLIEKQIVLENYNRRRYTAQYFPNLVGFAGYQYAYQSDTLFGTKAPAKFPQSYVGIKLNVPIFDGLRTNAKVQQSKVNLKKLDVSKEMFQSAAKLKANNALTQLQNSKDVYSTQKANVALAKSVYDKAMLKFKEGIGSSLDLNEAEAALKEADNNLLNAKFDYLQAKLALMQAKGELKEWFETK